MAVHGLKMDQIDTHSWPNTFDARPGGRRPLAPVPRPRRFPRLSGLGSALASRPLVRAVALPPHAPFPPPIDAPIDVPADTAIAPAAASAARVKAPARHRRSGRNPTHSAVVLGMLAGLLLICVLHALSHVL
jgi:hypothetical protein